MMSHGNHHCLLKRIFVYILLAPTSITDFKFLAYPNLEMLLRV